MDCGTGRAVGGRERGGQNRGRDRARLSPASPCCRDATQLEHGGVVRWHTAAHGLRGGPALAQEQEHRDGARDCAHECKHQLWPRRHQASAAHPRPHAQGQGCGRGLGVCAGRHVSQGPCAACAVFRRVQFEAALLVRRARGVVASAGNRGGPRVLAGWSRRQIAGPCVRTPRGGRLPVCGVSPAARGAVCRCAREQRRRHGRGRGCARCGRAQAGQGGREERRSPTHRALCATWGAGPAQPRDLASGRPPAERARGGGCGGGGAASSSTQRGAGQWRGSSERRVADAGVPARRGSGNHGWIPRADRDRQRQRLRDRHGRVPLCVANPCVLVQRLQVL